MIIESTCPFCASREADRFQFPLVKPNEKESPVLLCRRCQTIYPARRNVGGATHPPRSGVTSPKESISPKDHLWLTLRKKCSRYKVTKALDIGAFNGRVCYLLEQLGVDAYGVDIDAQLVEMGSQQGLNIYAGTFPDNVPEEILNRAPYDMITCNETVYYFVDIKKAILKMRDLLNDKGVIFMKFHNPYSYYYRAGKSIFSRYGGSVQWFPTCKTLTEHFKASGLVVRETSPWQDNWAQALFNMPPEKYLLLQKVISKMASVIIPHKFFMGVADRMFIVVQKEREA